MSKSRLWRRVFIWTGVSLLSIIVVILCALIFVLSPSKLTSLVNDLSNRYLNADVNFEKVELSLLGDFPYSTLKLSSGEIISKALGRENDTLVRFGSFEMSVNPFALMRDQIELRGIKLVKPYINCYISQDGKANWEIYDTSEDDSDATSSEIDLALDVDRIEITDGVFVFDSPQDSILSRTSLARFTVSGLRSNNYQLDVDTETSLQMDTLSMADSLRVTLSGGFGFDLRHSGDYSLQKMTVMIGDIPVTFDGNVSLGADSIVSDMNCSVNSAYISSLLGLVPSGMIPALQTLKTDAVMDVTAQVNGTYFFYGGKLPKVSADIDIRGGYLDYGNKAMLWDALKFDIGFRYDPLHADSTGIIVRDADIKGRVITLKGDATIMDIMNDPYISTCLVGNVDLGLLSASLPLPVDAHAQGVLGFDLDIDGRVSSLNPDRIGGARVNAAFTMNNLLIDMPTDTVYMMADKGELTIGANTNRRMRDSLIDKKGRVVYLTAKADTLHVNYKNQFDLVAGSASMNFRCDAAVFSKNNKQIRPVMGSGDLGYFKLSGPDSMLVKAEDAFAQFSIKPSTLDATLPHLKLSLGAMGMSMQTLVDSYTLNGSNVDINAVMISSASQRDARRAQVLDSLQVAYPDIARDSLFSHLQSRRRFVTMKDDFAQHDIDMSVSQGINTMLRSWDINGSIYAIKGYVVTPYFPIYNDVHNIDVIFNKDSVTLRGTRINAGGSDLRLTGCVSNISRVLAGRGDLKIDFNVESDTLNLNELIQTANMGYNNITAMDKELHAAMMNSTDAEELKKILETVNNEQTETSSLVIVPSNIEMNLNLNVNHGKYAHIMLNALTGSLHVKDRCMQLSDLKAVTDAGEITLNAIYATRSKEEINTGFDLDIRKVQVDKFIASVPSIDSILPMLRSFEGIIDCQVAATARLDTAMNILLPTLNGACRLSGEKLVLLDGETFTEISKMLKFKNRKRNIIDRIGVEMLVRDSQIEMFPFVIEMDRYKAAVSGVHKLDMSFNYHISILHSPIPFRLGVNVSGNMDKIKYRLGRARYKSENVPSYVELIDSTRLNLRKNITDIFQSGVEAAIAMQIPDIEEIKVPDHNVDTSSFEFTKTDSLTMKEIGLIQDTVAVEPAVKAKKREQKR